MPELKEKIRREQSQRVRALRKLLDISRPKLAARHPKLTKNSIRNWEEGLQSGLSHTGASHLVAAAQSLGVRVTESWLLEGKGDFPEKAPVAMPATEGALNLKSALQQLSQLFPKTISIRMKDTGEYAIGERLPNHEMYKAENALCIVETMEGEIKLGRLVKGANNNYCLDSDGKANILSIAPIVLILRDPNNATS